MKHLRFLTAFLMAVAMTFGSCSKEGPQGPQGPAGPQGPQGEQGVAGQQGSKGPKGDKGATGHRGATGARGPRGATGAKGEKGDQGATGPKGAKGDRGSAGPRGATGPRGARGPQGEKGDKGDPGTANVFYSDWIQLDFLFRSSSGYWIAVIDAPKITINIMRQGVVIVYLKTSTTSMVKLNYSIIGDYVVYHVSIGEIRIVTNAFYSRSYHYRYVIIPGSTQLRKSSPPPDYSDYQAVCEYYGIPE